MIRIDNFQPASRTVKQISKFAFLLTLFCSVMASYAQNPIITHMYTADPSAHVWDGKVWLYPSHDQDNANNYASMNGHHVFSSSDMVNWTDHGEIMHTDDLPWANNGYLWAPDANRKDGVYYYYYPAQLASDGTRNIGVATSDSPSGPFTDQGPIEGADGIDPCVFIDDDGQAYLFWGSNTLKYAKLNDDMITLQETDTVDASQILNFKEGAWIHKWKDTYYLSYAHTGVRKPLLYCTSNSIHGPWTYRGQLMDKEKYGGWTNHHSIVEFKEQWYLFYHNTSLSVAELGDTARETNFRRSVCIDKLFHNEDGTIQNVIQTDAGVDSVGDGAPVITENLALGKTAIQSSTEFDGEANLAVDGNTDGTFNNGSVTHTETAVGSWWQVDLGHDYAIERIFVWNRTDKLSIMTRLSNFTVQLLNSNQEIVWSSDLTTYPNPSLGMSAEGNTGRYVKVIQNDDNPLSLAEVQVYGLPLVTSLVKESSTTNLDVSVYPNPAQSSVYISGVKAGNYELLNEIGSVVLNGVIHSELHEVKVENLPQGVYLINITTTGSMKTEKILIK